MRQLSICAQCWRAAPESFPTAPRVASGSPFQLLVAGRRLQIRGTSAGPISRSPITASISARSRFCVAWSFASSHRVQASGRRIGYSHPCVEKPPSNSRQRGIQGGKELPLIQRLRASPQHRLQNNREGHLRHRGRHIYHGAASPAPPFLGQRLGATGDSRQAPGVFHGERRARLRAVAKEIVKRTKVSNPRQMDKADKDKRYKLECLVVTAERRSFIESLGGRS